MLSALVLFEANMVDYPNEWWVDTSATRHVCGERNMFFTYVPINGRNLIMGNSTTSRVVGIGKSGVEDDFWKRTCSHRCAKCA